jgi:hypothetical protein
MIVKYIANPKAQSSKASRIGSLLDYIEADGRADAQKAEYIGADGNFYSDSQQGQRAEMVALAMEATRSKDPVDHWLLSWKEGEQPTQAQCNEAVEILKRHLGMNESHLAVFALHRNTENYHLHVVLNRVNPVTMRVEDKGWCIDKAHKAIAELSTRRAGKQRKTLAMSPTAAVRSHDPAVRASFSPARRRGTMRIGHGAKLLGATEAAHPAVAAITGHAAGKRGPGKEIHQLRKQQLASVHRRLQRQSLDQHRGNFKSTPPKTSANLVDQKVAGSELAVNRTVVPPDQNSTPARMALGAWEF